ncbi:MAG TPA: serine/threonine-protein kinase [Kofleriaceae bacterium]|nr:serine/threonine-protein kinase [Kofleriaceae bacterium]
MQRDSQDEATETLAEGPRRKSQKRSREQPTRLGRYVILSELGRGGMSVVYVAYDPTLDRRVALKVVRGDKLTTAHRARLHREAQALARLSHPSVVTVFDVGDLTDDTFVAMELIDGMSLRDWLKTKRTWREIIKVILAAGRGLAAAHAAGIVHRDIKPDNIVIATSGAVKVVDFGLARDLGDRSIETGEHSGDDLDQSASSYDSGRHSGSISSSSGSSRPLDTITQMGNVVGTPAYMPPEARSKRPEADERSDQFSLCVTIYEALYGQKPFKVSRKGVLDRAEMPTVADDPEADMRTLAAAPPRDTDVPAWLQKVVSRGLAVEPGQRYPSVNALLADLDRDPQRTRRRIAAAAGALLAVAGVATFITSRVMPTEQVAAKPSCSTGDERINAVWNPQRLAAMKASPAARGAPWVAGAIDAFGARVDKYAGEWKAMYVESCQATRVNGIQSEEALDLRTACLDRHLESLGALVNLMADAKVETLRRAGEVVDNLPPVADCADVKALRLVVKRPTDPKVIARLDAIDRNLAQLSALYAIGDVNKAIEVADRVIAESEAIGYAPPLAQGLYWRGRSIADRTGGEEAVAMFDKTFSAALSAGEDQMAADAASRIAQEALFAAQLPEFDRWQRITHAMANRVNAANIVAFSDQLGCMANHFYGRPKTRLACLQKLVARVGPNEWLVTTLGIAASEAGKPAEAIHWLEKGVELARSENGPDHPRTLEMRAYLCKGLHELGDYKRSADECRDALTRLQKSAPDDHLLIARIRMYLAESEIELQHPDVARALLEAAKGGGEDEVKLEATTTLTELSGAPGTVSAEAIAQHRAAVAENQKVFEPFNKRHPNIVAARHELGVALLRRGDAPAALIELAKADTDADPAEISSLELAQIRYAHAEALFKARASDRAEARKLAAEALDIYVKDAPDTERFRKERTAIEGFIAKLDAGAR